MCLEIDSRCVIFNMLQVNKEIHLAQLATFATAFKQKVNAAYVDISDTSVFSVVEEYRGLISLSGDVIVREEGFRSLLRQDFLDRTINRHLAPEVCHQLHECAADALGIA